MRRRAGSGNGFGDLPIDEVAARRQRRLMVGVLVALVVVAAGTGVLVAVIHGHHPRPGHHRSAIGVVIALAVTAVVLLALAGWAVWLYRRPSYRRVMQYGWSRRWRVAKALRKGRPVAEQDIPVAAAMVNIQRRQWWQPWLYIAIGVIWVINGLLGHHGAGRWFWVGIGVLYLMLVPFVVVQRRRTITNYDRLHAPVDTTR